MRQRVPRVGRTPIPALVGLLLLALMAAPARALHKESLPAYRITTGSSHAHPQARSWGTYFPFVASEDLEHNGNTRQEIFFYNLTFFDCFEGTTFAATPCPNPICPFLVQATYGPGDPDNPTLAVPFATNGTLTRIGSGDRSNTCTYECKPLSAGGPCTVSQWLAFDAEGSFFGATGPSASHRQIFMKDLATGEIRSVTSGVDGESTRPVMNKQGGLVFFESTAHLLPTATPAGVSQIYVYHTKAHLLRQLTFGLGPSTNPVANESGNLIAFESTADLLGSGADTGTSQIFWIQYDKVTGTPELHQLTKGNGPSQHPYISNLFSIVAFDSSATNLPGSTGTTATSRSIFVSTPLEAKAPQPPALTQLTFPDRFGDCSDPMMAGNGAEHIGFVCTGDPLQNGTTGRRAFVFEPSTETLMQITGKGDVQPPIGGNLGIWFLTMSTTDDLTGKADCGYQLWVVDYLGTNQCCHDPKWIPATQIGQLPPDVVPPSPSPGPTDSSLIGKRNFVILPGASTTTTTTLVPIATTTTLGVGTTTTTLGAGTTTTIVAASTTTTTLGGSQGSMTTSDGTSTTGLEGSGSFTLVIGGAEEFAHQASIKVPATHALLPPVVGPQVTACLAASADGEGVIDCDGIDPGGDLHVTRYHVSDATPVQRVDADGTFAAGGMRLAIPVTVSFSVDAGTDHHFCTNDDTYTAKGIASTLWLTSGSVEIDIVDADGTPGATLTVSDMGSPFNCAALQAGVMAGAQLVGGLPLLDVPESVGPRDMIVSLRLDPQGDQPCQQPCTTNLDCDDGNACNGAETCVSGFCQPGTPLDCNDGDPCTTDGCDPATGLCTHLPCDDGNPCNGVETCDPTTGCQPGTPIVCSDGNACNGVETCDPTTGACLPGTPPNCDDGNPCTDDSCDPTLGCVHTPNALPCDDGNGCTTGDTCQGGSCVGTPVECDDGNVCNGFETCDPATGACLPGVPPNCDDGNPCTTDTCDPTLGCVYVNNTAPCDDGNPCTTGDACSGGTCVGVPVVCSDGNACNGIETCDPTTGACLPGTPVVCNDGNPCDIGTCDPLTGTCTYTPNPLCQAQALVAQGQALAALVATANPADLGGPRQKTQFQSTLQTINRQLARALAHRAHRARRLRAVSRRLGRFQLALRRGMSRGRVDVGLANDLMDRAGSLMTAVQEFISPSVASRSGR